MSQDRFFRLKGRVLDHDGKGVRMFITVVDVDPIENDVIALGTSDTDGTFELSFTREAFNQGLFEREAKPDVLLVIVRARGADGKLRELLSHRVEAPSFDQNLEDVGDIVLAETAPEPVEYRPGDLMDFALRHHRLTIDAEVIAHLVAEVAPIVEELTGWRGIAAGVQIRAGSVLPAREEMCSKAAGDVREHAWFKDLLAPLRNRHGNGVLAFYDPFDHVITLDESILSEAGLDAAKVVLGHELVHAGQFHAVPALVSVYKGTLATLSDRSVTAYGAPLSDRQQAALRRSYALMLAVEGHASLIEEGLVKRFPFGRFTGHLSPLDLLYHLAVTQGPPLWTTLTGVSPPAQAPLDLEKLGIDDGVRLLLSEPLMRFKYELGKELIHHQTKPGERPRFDHATLGKCEAALPGRVKEILEAAVAARRARSAAAAT